MVFRGLNPTLVPINDRQPCSDGCRSCAEAEQEVECLELLNGLAAEWLELLNGLAAPPKDTVIAATSHTPDTEHRRKRPVHHARTARRANTSAPHAESPARCPIMEVVEPTAVDLTEIPTRRSLPAADAPARATEEERAAHADRITREGSVGGRAGYQPPKRDPQQGPPKREAPKRDRTPPLLLPRQPRNGFMSYVVPPPPPSSGEPPPPSSRVPPPPPSSAVPPPPSNGFMSSLVPPLPSDSRVPPAPIQMQFDPVPAFPLSHGTPSLIGPFTRWPLFERDVYNARNTFWHRSTQCAANHVIDGGSVSELLDFIKSKSPSSDALDDIMKSVQATFKKDPDVCAACGIFCDGDSAIAIASLPRDVFVLRGEASGMETVHRSGQEAYRLYSDGIRITDGHEVGMFCCECSNAHRKGKVSQFSLAGGLDFGKIPECMRKLSLFERMAIARVRPFINLVKLTPKGGYRLDGHVISFEHDAVERLGAVLPHPDLSAAINVMFVGTPEDWRRKKADLLQGVYPQLYSVFGLEKKKIEECLAFLTVSNPFWRDAAFSEEHLRRVVQSRDDVLDHVQIASSEGVAVNAVVTSDVANVRPHEENGDGDDVRDGEKEKNSKCAVEHVMVSSPAAPADSNLLNALNGLLNGGNAIPVARSSIPMNEFLVNDEAIYKTFPNLFPLGSGLVGHKTMSTAMVKHLLLFHDGRFAQDMDFLFLFRSRALFA